MEILHCCPSRSFSGLEQYALEMALDQKKRGHAVSFIVAPGTQLEEECRRGLIETVPFDPYETFWPARFWPRLNRILREQNDLKVIHLHSTQEIAHVGGPVLWGHLRRRRPKVILQSHIWINHRKKDPFHRFLYSLVDEIWCSSEAARKSLAENLPVSEQKFKIMRYGRDIETITKNFLSPEEARKKLGLPASALCLGTVSRLEKSKGIAELIAAAEPLLEKNENLHLVIVGAASPGDAQAAVYSDDIKNKVAAMSAQVKNRIHFPGQLADSFRYLKAFDLYVLPSYQETFSLSLLDAQLAGLPVVGSESGGTPDVVVSGQTGWLFKPKDVESLRGEIQNALKEKNRWQEFGRKASEAVKKNFNKQTVFEKILLEYGA